MADNQYNIVIVAFGIGDNDPIYELKKKSETDQPIDQTTDQIKNDGGGVNDDVTNDNVNDCELEPLEQWLTNNPLKGPGNIEYKNKNDEPRTLTLCSLGSGSIEMYKSLKSEKILSIMLSCAIPLEKHSGVKPLMLWKYDTRFAPGSMSDVRERNFTDVATNEHNYLLIPIDKQIVLQYGSYQKIANTLCIIIAKYRSLSPYYEEFVIMSTSKPSLYFYDRIDARLYKKNIPIFSQNLVPNHRPHKNVDDDGHNDDNLSEPLIPEQLDDVWTDGIWDKLCGHEIGSKFGHKVSGGTDYKMEPNEKHMNIDSNFHYIVIASTGKSESGELPQFLKDVKELMQFALPKFGYTVGHFKIDDDYSDSGDSS
jgi:hypothetical protein